MIRFHSFETLGTLEGPGIRLLVFLQGCNAECVYCHNPDTWPNRGGNMVEDEFILDRVKREIAYFGKEGGVTFSGGDPIVQTRNLIPLMKKIKEMGVHTALETNASIFNDDVRELLDNTDLLLLDLKHIDPEWRKKITHLDYDPLLLAQYREEKKMPFWLRYVLMPGYTDQDEYMIQAAKVFSEYTMLDRVDILPYHKDGIEKYDEMGIEYKYRDVPAPTDEQIKNAKEIFSRYLPHVVIE